MFLFFEKLTTDVVIVPSFIKKTRQSSSFVGPLIVGLIADSTGNIRYAFFFLVFMIWLAVPVLLSVDVERGRIDAQTYSVERVEQEAFSQPVER